MGKPTVEITDDNFEDEVTRSPLPVVVDFWAEWCGPCRRLGPTIDELAEEYAGRVKVGKLNTDLNPATSVRFQIKSIPTVMLFKGGRKQGAFVGVRPKEELSDAIASLLA